LKSEVSYEEAMNQILLKGGDTDTNAAIVGGIMGAAVGLSNIPPAWVQKMMDSQPKRPDFLIPKD